MIAALSFAVILGVVGYDLTGWSWAIAAPVGFLVVLPLINLVVLRNGPENLRSMAILLQMTRLLVFGAFVLGMLVLAPN